jgi:hypothetical protein
MALLWKKFYKNSAKKIYQHLFVFLVQYLTSIPPFYNTDATVAQSALEFVTYGHSFVSGEAVAVQVL